MMPETCPEPAAPCSLRGEFLSVKQMVQSNNELLVRVDERVKVTGERVLDLSRLVNGANGDPGLKGIVLVHDRAIEAMEQMLLTRQIREDPASATVKPAEEVNQETLEKKGAITFRTLTMGLWLPLTVAAAAIIGNLVVAGLRAWLGF